MVYGPQFNFGIFLPENADERGETRTRNRGKGGLQTRPYSTFRAACIRVDRRVSAFSGKSV